MKIQRYDYENPHIKKELAVTAVLGTWSWDADKFSLVSDPTPDGKLWVVTITKTDIKALLPSLSMFAARGTLQERRKVIRALKPTRTARRRRSKSRG